MAIAELVTDAFKCLSEKHRKQLKQEHERFKSFEGHYLSNPDEIPARLIEAKDFLLRNRYIDIGMTRVWSPAEGRDIDVTHFICTEEGNERLTYLDELRHLFAFGSKPSKYHSLRHCLL